MTASSLSPDTRRFSFELTVEITSSLAISAGELSELMADGLLALDEEGILFPGVSIPANGYRLLDVGIRHTGYARPGNLVEPNAAYRAMMAGNAHRPGKAGQQMGERLRNAAAEVHAGILRQRMLIARLRALGGWVGEPAAITEVEPVVAEGLIAAASSVTAAVEAAFTPVM
jgi:hypothetical protein